jgi:hypothetical protein
MQRLDCVVDGIAGRPQHERVHSGVFELPEVIAVLLG